MLSCSTSRYQEENENVPKISVVIPVRNVEKYLRQCLDSVLAQSFKDLEIICLDNASSDSSLEILHEYEKRDSRIIVIANKKDIGLGPSRNKGILSARGKYIHFLDSDDWIEQDTYKNLYKIAEENNLDFLKFTPKPYIETETNISVPTSFEDGITGRVLLPEENLCLFDMLEMVTPMLFKRDFVLDNGLLFKNILHEDTPFYIEALIKAQRVMYINEDLYNYRIRGGSIMDGCRKEFGKLLEWYNVMKALSEGINDTNISRKIFRRAFDTVLQRYSLYRRLRPFCALRYLFKMLSIIQCAIRLDKNIFYEISKKIIKKCFPTFFKFYLNMKKFVLKRINDRIILCTK